MEVRPTAMVLADISGYTGFIKLHGKEFVHAEQHIADLLESVVAHAEYPLSINKFEGDAVFMYAFGDDSSAVTRDVARQIDRLFEGFRAKQYDLTCKTMCPCQACANIDKLRLKTIVHFGDVVFKRIRNFEDIGGEPAIVIHRLLKNSVPSREYILMTDPFYTLSGGLPEEKAEVRSEKAEGIGDIKVHIYYRGDKSLPPPKSTFWSRLGFNLRLMWYSGRRRLGLIGRRQPAAAPKDAHDHQ